MRKFLSSIHRLVRNRKLLTPVKTQFLIDISHSLAQVSYSQQGEDLAISRFFENRQEGYYVDVGAFHPKLYSNTFLFYLKGWRGINIEPNSQIISEFEKYRPRDKNICIAIGETPGILPYFMFDQPALNSFSKEHALYWNSKQGFSLLRTIDIEMVTLENILDRNLPDGQSIDFLNVDVESFDLQVLRSNNWKKYRPKLVLAETSIYESDRLSDNGIISYLDSVGYKLWNVEGGTLIFIDNK